MIGLNFSDLMILSFAGGYFVALVGVYQRALYGPLIGMIIGFVDLMFAFILIQFLDSGLMMAVIVDIAIVGFSYREYSLINKTINQIYRPQQQDQPVSSNFEQTEGLEEYGAKNK